jgi:hypothetical protein
LSEVEPIPPAGLAASAGSGTPAVIGYAAGSVSYACQQPGLSIEFPMSAAARRAWALSWICDVVPALVVLAFLPYLSKKDWSLMHPPWGEFAFVGGFTAVVFGLPASICIWGLSRMLGPASIRIDGDSIELLGNWRRQRKVCRCEYVLKVRVDSLRFTRFALLAISAPPVFALTVGIAEQASLEDVASRLRAELNVEALEPLSRRRWWSK